MTSGQIVACVCGRLVIYGQTCTCGRNLIDKPLSEPERLLMAIFGKPDDPNQEDA